MDISTLHGTRSVSCSRAKVDLHSADGDFRCEVGPVIIANLPIQKATTINVRNLSHMADLQFLTLPNKSVGILKGCDVPETHIVIDQRVGSGREPFAMKSQLGWVVRGIP